MLYETEGEHEWERFAPHLDEALASLGSKDREAILLRFFEAKPWAEVGRALASNENAARIRVQRATGKLRAFFAKRGIVIALDTLTRALHENAGRTLDRFPESSTIATARAEALANRLLRRMRIQRLRRTATAVLFVSALLLGAFIDERTQQSRLQAAGARLAFEVDRAFTSNDPAAFLALIIFRDAADDAFRPVFRDYLAAASDFRNEMTAEFNTSRAWAVTFRPLFAQRLNALPQRWNRHFMVTRPTPDYTFLARRVGDEWKWDFFSQIPEGEREGWLNRLSRDAARFHQIADHLRETPVLTEGEVWQQMRGAIE
jgi:hypothetical protein